MTYSMVLAKFIEELSLSSIPQSVIERSKMLMLDTIGVAYAGSTSINAKNGREALRNMPNSQGNIAVWGVNDLCLAMPYAILANGIAAHILDFDDTHTQSIVHGSAILTPVTLNLAQYNKNTGAEVLEAFICGWEVAARIGIAAQNTFHQRGFHSTAIAGVFGATAAACKLYKLNQKQIINAFGLCGSQAAGTNEFLANSSSSKCFHAGLAGFSAILNTNLAQMGMTGPDTIFEGKNSIFNTHGIKEKTNPALVIDQLNKIWQTECVSIKPYPCCHFTHGFVDCGFALHHDKIHADDIQWIQCVVDEVPTGFICEPSAEKQKPLTSYAAKFSLPFIVASAITDNEITEKSFMPKNLKRDDLVCLAQKVSYVKAKKGTTGFPKYFPGELHVRLYDGTIIHKKFPINKGNPDNPLSLEDILLKFQQNMENNATSVKIKSLTDLIFSLEKHQSIFL